MKGFVALAIICVLLPAVGALGLFGPIQEAAEYLRERGTTYLPIFVVIAALGCGLAVLPTHAISLAAGFIFGPIIGLCAALMSIVLGAMLGWAVTGRLVGRSLRDVVDCSSIGAKIAGAMIDARGLQAVLAVTLARLPPQVPFALGNAIAASLKVRFAAFVSGTAMGMLPRVLLVVWIGSQLTVMQREGGNATLIFSILASVIAMIGLGWWSWRILRRQAGPVTGSS